MVCAVECDELTVRYTVLQSLASLDRHNLIACPVPEPNAGFDRLDRNLPVPGEKTALGHRTTSVSPKGLYEILFHQLRYLLGYLCERLCGRILRDDELGGHPFGNRHLCAKQRSKEKG